MSVIFLDDFNRAPSVTVGNGWSQSGAVYVNGVLGANEPGSIWRTLPAGANLDVQFDVAAWSYGDLYLKLLTSNRLNGYGVSVATGAVVLYRYNNGNSVILAVNNSFNSSSPATYRLTVGASTVTVFRNGSQILQATDTTHARSGLTTCQVDLVGVYEWDPDWGDWYYDVYADNVAIYGTATQITVPIHLLRTQMIPAL